MTGSILPPDSMEGTEFVDNTSFSITPAFVRNLCESAFSMVPSPNGIQTASYTAKVTDRGTIVGFNVATGPANYTIPSNLSVALPVSAVLGMIWLAGAAIQPTFVAGSGVTIANPAFVSLRAVGCIGYAWQWSANTWYLFGDLA